MKLFREKSVRKNSLITSAGFTLVELLVVVSIIAFLSSIVLATLNTAREKAKATAFRAEVDSFIKALELYKSDNGSYPGEELLVSSPASVNYYYTGNPTAAIAIPSSFDLLNALIPKYISKLPDPVLDTTQFNYKINGTNTLLSKCWGDTNTPPYIVRISASEPGFSDWPFIRTGNTSTAPNTDIRCFSLK